VDADTSSSLIEFDAPVEAGGMRYTHAVASPRLERDDINSLKKSNVLGSAITWIPDNRFNPKEPFNLGWWRGGAAAIADIVLV
jgi:hypothetical protein